jgi:hypothetical protein
VAGGCRGAAGGGRRLANRGSLQRILSAICRSAGRMSAASFAVHRPHLPRRVGRTLTMRELLAAEGGRLMSV